MSFTNNAPKPNDMGDCLKQCKIDERQGTALIPELIGQLTPHLYSLGHGYSWDSTTETVQQLFRKEGDSPPVFNRNERRKIQREVRKAKKAEKRREADLWAKFSQQLNIYNDCQTKLDNSQATDPAERNQDQLNRVVAAKNNAIDKIKACLEQMNGSNGILRFLLWSIQQIGQEMATKPELRAAYLTSETAFTRERDITLPDVLLFLLTMSGDNMNNEVYEYFKMTRSHPSAAAMVERRKLIKAEGICYFFHRITAICRTIIKNLPDTAKNQTRSAINMIQQHCSFDGSGINIAYDPADEKTFVQRKDDQRGYNQVYLNAQRESKSGLFLDAVVQPITELNEVKATTAMINRMDHSIPSLISGDRGYGCLSLIYTIIKTPNLDCLLRVKENWIRETRELPLANMDSQLTIHVTTRQTKDNAADRKAGRLKYISGNSPYGKNKSSQTWFHEEQEAVISFRVVRFQLESGEWETLVTTLSKDIFTADDLKRLYFERWRNIETGFRYLKWDNHLSQMHSKSLNSSLQEIYARLAMHNIVSCVMKVAECVDSIYKKISAADEGVPPTDFSTRHIMAINRRFATHLICDYLKNSNAISFDVIDMMLQHKCPVRPGRSFKRDLRKIGFVSFGYR